MGDATFQTKPLVSLQTHRLPADIYLDERALCDLELLLMGALKPLTGYMTAEDYECVMSSMRLKTGEVFPMPIALAVPVNELRDNKSVDSSDTTASVVLPCGKQNVKLRDAVGVIVAEFCVTDIYYPDVEREMMAICGTTDMNHPHVKYLAKTHANVMYCGGEVTSVQPISHFDFRQHRLNTDQVKHCLESQNAQQVVGFQTRNPMHRSHYELTREAVNRVTKQTGQKTTLLLTPAVGPTQVDDVEYHIRVRCYEKILPEYEKDGIKVILVLLPLAMRMCGPREAVWHAIIRKNFGCTHFIVGRDHAGPSSKTADGKSFYGAYEAHELLAKYEKELGIQAVFAKNMVYVGAEHGGYLEETEVPKGVDMQNISGTAFRNMLQKRTAVPEWFSFPQVIQELHRFYLPMHQRGLCVYFTGLPCSGKSTLSVALQEKILENPTETRRVTVLDADIIRRHLSKGLGFSRDDRSTNVRRIGYVAHEIVKHNGICLVANIAPYEEDRACNRDLISQGGEYIEIHVATPIDVCECRDIKELYKKARQGIIQQFTGVSDPYEEPLKPELKINSSGDLNGTVEEVFNYLKKRELVI